MENKTSLSQTLEKTLDVPEGTPISIGSITDNVQGKGFGLFLIILSLPSALPVPAPGYSIPFGLALIILGYQMLKGANKPILFERVRKTRVELRFGEENGSIRM